MDILDRDPEAVFVLTSSGTATYDVVLTVSSASDYLTAAMGTLRKTGPYGRAGSSGVGAHSCRIGRVARDVTSLSG